MATIESIITLACAISGAQDKAPSLQLQLTAADTAIVQEVVNSGACLPENLEKILKKSKLNSEDQDSAHAPTDSCFST